MKARLRETRSGARLAGRNDDAVKCYANDAIREGVVCHRGGERTRRGRSPKQFVDSRDAIREITRKQSAMPPRDAELRTPL